MKRTAVLVEILFGLLFLALSMTAVLQLISRAYLCSTASERKQRASLAMQELIERYHGDPQREDTVVGYDAAFCPADADSAVNTVRVDVEAEKAGTGVLYRYCLTALDAGGAEIAALAGACYAPGEVSP